MTNALQFLVLTAAAWLNRQQRDVIDYLREENRILREKIGSRRIRFTDAQRRRLALRGRNLGRRIPPERSTRSSRTAASSRSSCLREVRT